MNNEQQILDELKEIKSILENLQHRYKKWLSVKELSKYLGLSKSKIRKLKSEERIPYQQIDGIIRFNTNMIDLWMAYSGSKLSFTKRDKSKLEIL